MYFITALFTVVVVNSFILKDDEVMNLMRALMMEKRMMSMAVLVVMKTQGNMCSNLYVY